MPSMICERISRRTWFFSFAYEFVVLVACFGEHEKCGIGIGSLLGLPVTHNDAFPTFTWYHKENNKKF